MTQLAIRGHATRGEEVIEILEMLGGNNPDKLIANFDYLGYFIGKETRNIYHFHLQGFDSQNVIIFTLEEFLEKFPYKIGDKVSSKYLKNHEVSKMEWENTNNRVIYKLQGMGWYSADELQPYKEEAMEIMEEGVYAYNEINCYHQDFADKVQIRLGGDYKIEVEDGKTYIVRKKPQYPKTYLECCRIIVAKQDRHYYYTKKDKEQDYPNEVRILDQLDHLRMLIICRDAYWKITGEQMKLGKPWEPDWSNDLLKYYISFYNNKVDKGVISYSNKILAFPTEEMRDAFYENFKSLIESCKELL